MELRLERKWFEDTCTIGKLYVDDEYECYILEDVVRPLGEKVYGETAIPYGDYTVIVNRSNRFKKDLPFIYNMPDMSVEDGHGVRFTGIRIHPGNTDADTHGCLLPGASKMDNKIGDSRLAFNKLFAKICAAIDAEEDVVLTIVREDA